jgi:Raf kinase inhibitor-like YbhB/YbcL family protein
VYAHVLVALGSEAFGSDKPIPSRFTCEGEKLSPPLTWVGLPAGSESFALVMSDPDAPGGAFTHWLIYNIDSKARVLSEDVEKVERPAKGAGGIQGRNDFGEIGYSGPCPPHGELHRYEFRLYVIDGPVDLAPGAELDELLARIDGRILKETALTGTYERTEG